MFTSNVNGMTFILGGGGDGGGVTGKRTIV